MISVVRETETQLLPDVGAIVTCKVWVEIGYNFSINGWSDSVFLHSFGLSGALSFFACAGDQHQPQVRQGPHPICRLHAAEGPLQGDNQVTAKKLPPSWPNVSCFISLRHSRNWTHSLWLYRKEDVRATEKDKVRVFIEIIISFFCGSWLLNSLRRHAWHNAFVFIVAGGDVQKLQTRRYCPGESGILHLPQDLRQIPFWSDFISSEKSSATI